MELLRESIGLGQQASLHGDRDRLGSQAAARPAAFAGTLKPGPLCGSWRPEGVPDELSFVASRKSPVVIFRCDFDTGTLPCFLRPFVVSLFLI
jgi:hypothetical protein